jgi:hypothetical protein
VADLITEVDRFRAWADAYPHAGQYGEWECDYTEWPALYEAVFQFVAGRPFESWSDAEVRAVLYALARDNEMQHLSREFRKRHPELLEPLAREALDVGERDDSWQLAVELGSIGIGGEQLLLELARDRHEYVRRRALESLARIGSPAVAELALAMWHRPDEDQEHARMMVLHCLELVGSPQLESLLAEAERDARQYLRGFAVEMRRYRSTG